MELKKKRNFKDISEIEQAVIASLFKDKKHQDYILQSLRPNHFYTNGLSGIFGECLSFYIMDVEISKQAVDLEITENCKKILEKCFEINYLESNIPYFCKKIIEESKIRDVNRLAERLQSSSNDSGKDYDKLFSEIHEGVLELISEHDEEGIFTPALMSEIVISDLENRQEGKIDGIKTYLQPVDSLIGGFTSSNLTILAARPGFGKTQLALQICAENCKNGKPVLFLSLEMPEIEIMQRLLSRDAQVNLQRLNLEKLKIDELEKVRESMKVIETWPFYFKSLSSLSVAELRAKTKRVNMQTGGNLALVVVDYLQLMTGDDSQNRNDVVGSFSRGMKQLAMEMHIPVLGLCQLNRDPEKRTDKRPMLSDLRESGSIEQDCSIAAFLYREFHYSHRKEHENDLELLIRKNRNGPIGNFKLFNDPRTQSIKPR